MLFVPWFDFLDLSKVSDEDRFRVLEYAVSKHGRARVQEVLGGLEDYYVEAPEQAGEG